MEDLEGVWSPDMFALYIPVALEMQINELLRMRLAVLSAVGTAFSSDASRALFKDLRGTLLEIRKAQYRARGLDPDTVKEVREIEGPQGESEADQFVRIFRRLGIVPEKA